MPADGRWDLIRHLKCFFFPPLCASSRLRGQGRAALSFIIIIIFINFSYGMTRLKTHTLRTTASVVKDDTSTFHSQTSFSSNKTCSVGIPQQ